MSDDVAANRLLVVCCEHSSSVDLRNDLVSHHYCHSKLVREALEVAQEFGQTHLAGRELTSAGVVCAIERRRGIDHQEGKAILAHEGRRLLEKLVLML